MKGIVSEAMVRSHAFILKALTGRGVRHCRRLRAGLRGVTRSLRPPQFRQHGRRCGIYSERILRRVGNMAER